MAKANTKRVKSSAPSNKKTTNVQKSAPRDAASESEVVFLHVPISRKTRSAITKLKTALSVSNQGEVVTQLVREELKRQKANG